MSACNPKPELLAIYRLEFYKKQQNWKLSTKRHDGNKKCSKKKKHVVKNANLNSTHEAENWEENEVSDPLNIAFVKTEPENIPPQAHLSPQCSLTQEWQEPINIKPLGAHSEPEDTPRYNQHQVTTEECWTGDPTAAVDREQELHNLMLEQNARNMAKEVNWGGAEGDGCMHCGCDAYEALMQTPPPVNEIWPEEAAAKPSDAADGNCPHELMASPPQEVHNWSLDSQADFCRGAHVVPHSSEIDLSLPPSLQTPHPSVASLSRMTTQQLKKSVEHSSRTLKILESECEWRRLRERQNYGMDDLDEVPTRDLDPSLPHPPIRDRILAGSHMAWGVAPHEVWEVGHSQLLQGAGEPQPVRGVGRLETALRLAYSAGEMHQAEVPYPTWSEGETNQARGVVEPQPAWALSKPQPAYSEGETHRVRRAGTPYPTWSEGETHQVRGVREPQPIWSEKETRQTGGIGVTYPTWSKGETHEVREIGVPYPTWSEGEKHQLRELRELQPVWSERETHQAQGEVGPQLALLMKKPRTYWRSEGETPQVRGLSEPQHACGGREPQPASGERETHQDERRSKDETRQAQGVGVPYPTWSETHQTWGVPQHAYGVGELQPAWSEGETHQVRGVGVPHAARGVEEPPVVWSVRELQVAHDAGARDTGAPQQVRVMWKQELKWEYWRVGEHQRRGRGRGRLIRSGVLEG